MDKYILVEYLNSSNNSISETFKATHRIKLTSFDVCKTFVIFGANSGGIYVFKRNPYDFFKLIPSKEGTVAKICVSPDEKHLAVASLDGVIIILENFTTDVNALPLMYYEHEGNTIEALKWHGNNLYCGDNTGKISVCTLSTLLSKAIFQNPSVVLMHLDSRIVQIDTFHNFLLISTRTRTYLCDTEKEQYKQIGKKLRDGSFGACFLSTDNTEFVVSEEKKNGTFKTIKDGELFSNITDINTKIYCARPGMRLWEANFEATVVVTHQFRDSISQRTSEMLIIENKCDAKFELSVCDSELSKKFSFGKLYPIIQRFIFTYDNSGIYFFDPVTNHLEFWTNAFNDVRDVKVFDDHIYIWRKDLKISTVTVQSLEDLCMTSLLRKQYLLCAGLCIRYSYNIINLLETSKKIHLISILQKILTDKGETNLLKRLSLIFEKIEEYKKMHYGQKLHKEIVTVENFYLPSSKEDIFIPERVQNFQSEKKCEESTKEKNLLALYKQYVLNKSHRYAELTETNNLLRSLNLNKIVLLFEDFESYVIDKYNENARDWCQGQIIKRASQECLTKLILDKKTLNYLDESYLEINKFRNLNCKCYFPLPCAHLQKPEYYELGCKLMEINEKDTEYVLKIPYFYEYKLKRELRNPGIIQHLPKVVQFSDKELYKHLLSLFTYDNWDEMLRLFIKIKQGCCLNCGRRISLEGLISWQELAILINRSIGPKNTCRLLKMYTKYIPKGELDDNFYKGCIFAAVCGNSEKAINFMETVAANHASEFETSMKKFIEEKYIGKQSLCGYSVMSLDSGTCAFCILPLNGPIITGSKETGCEHVFHSLCLKYNNGRCKICVPT